MSEGLKMKHIPGQEGRVDDQEKARKMAEAQDVFESRASFLGEYQKDPTTFLANNPDMAPEELELFKQLSEADITAEDLREVGDRYAEARATAYDYAQELPDKSWSSLQIDDFVNSISLLKNNIASGNNPIDVMEPTRIRGSVSQRDAFVKQYAALMKVELIAQEKKARWYSDPSIRDDEELIEPGTWMVHGRNNPSS
jgi:hypothetical protein